MNIKNSLHKNKHKFLGKKEQIVFLKYKSKVIYINDGHQASWSAARMAKPLALLTENNISKQKKILWFAKANLSKAQAATRQGLGLPKKNLAHSSLSFAQVSTFFNFTFDKGRLKNLVSWTLENYGQYKTIELLEQLKKTGFEYATKAGISLGIDDLKIPPKKKTLLLEAEKLTKLTVHQYQRADITAVERFQRLIDTWHRTSEQLKQEVIAHFEETDILNPVYMMAFSGARGNISQVRQLVGMRGLMSDPQGQIIDFPIRSNFREGLTLTEYIISSYGARKGIVDTALRTANAGYLTRRLVDVAQHVIISHYDCGTQKGIFLTNMKEGNKTIVSVQSRILGRVLARDIVQPNTKIKIASRNQEITTDLAFEITKITNKVFVRSSLTCNTNKLLCQLCYGWSLAQGNLVSVGEAVGVIAAQSIGEPGTQLTMRTFHTGGVFSGDVSDEIRAPYNGFVHYDHIIPGILIRTLDGKIRFLTKSNGTLIFSLNSKLNFLEQIPKGPVGTASDSKDMFLSASITRSSLSFAQVNSDIRKFKIPAYTILFMRNGEFVLQKQVVAQITSIASKPNVRDTAELIIKSEFEGLFYSKKLQIQKKLIGPKPKLAGEFKQNVLFDPKAMEIVVKARGWNFAWVLSGKRYEMPLLLKSFPIIGDYINQQTIITRHNLKVPTIYSVGTYKLDPSEPVKAAIQSTRKDGYLIKNILPRSSLSECDLKNFKSQNKFLNNLSENCKAVGTELYATRKDQKIHKIQKFLLFKIFANLSKAQAATRKTKIYNTNNLRENCKAVGTELYATRQKSIKNILTTKKFYQIASAQAATRRKNLHKIKVFFQYRKMQSYINKTKFQTILNTENMFKANHNIILNNLSENRKAVGTELYATHEIQKTNNEISKKSLIKIKNNLFFLNLQKIKYHKIGYFHFFNFENNLSKAQAATRKKNIKIHSDFTNSKILLAPTSLSSESTLRKSITLKRFKNLKYLLESFALTNFLSDSNLSENCKAVGTELYASNSNECLLNINNSYIQTVSPIVLEVFKKPKQYFKKMLYNFCSAKKNFMRKNLKTHFQITSAQAATRKNFTFYFNTNSLCYTPEICKVSFTPNKKYRSEQANLLRTNFDFCKASFVKTLQNIHVDTKIKQEHKNFFEYQLAPGGKLYGLLSQTEYKKPSKNLNNVLSKTTANQAKLGQSLSKFFKSILTNKKVKKYKSFYKTNFKIFLTRKIVAESIKTNFQIASAQAATRKNKYGKTIKIKPTRLLENSQTSLSTLVFKSLFKNLSENCKAVGTELYATRKNLLLQDSEKISNLSKTKKIFTRKKNNEKIKVASPGAVAFNTLKKIKQNIFSKKIILNYNKIRLNKLNKTAKFTKYFLFENSKTKIIEFNNLSKANKNFKIFAQKRVNIFLNKTEKIFIFEYLKQTQLKYKSTKPEQSSGCYAQILKHFKIRKTFLNKPEQSSGCYAPEQVRSSPVCSRKPQKKFFGTREGGNLSKTQAATRKNTKPSLDISGLTEQIYFHNKIIHKINQDFNIFTLPKNLSKNLTNKDESKAWLPILLGLIWKPYYHIPSFLQVKLNTKIVKSAIYKYSLYSNKNKIIAFNNVLKYVKKNEKAQTNLSENCAQQPELKRFEAVGTELYATRKIYDFFSGPHEARRDLQKSLKKILFLNKKFLITKNHMNYICNYFINLSKAQAATRKKLYSILKIHYILENLNYLKSSFVSYNFLSKIKNHKNLSKAQAATRKKSEQSKKNFYAQNLKVYIFFKNNNLSENCAKQPELKRFEAVGTELYATRQTIGSNLHSQENEISRINNLSKAQAATRKKNFFAAPLKKDSSVWVYKTIKHKLGEKMFAHKTKLPSLFNKLTIYPGNFIFDNILFDKNAINPLFHISTKVLSKIASQAMEASNLSKAQAATRYFDAFSCNFPNQKKTKQIFEIVPSLSFARSSPGSARVKYLQKIKKPPVKTALFNAALTGTDKIKQPEQSSGATPKASKIKDLDRIFKTEIFKENFVWIKNKKPRFLPKHLEKQIKLNDLEGLESNKTNKIQNKIIPSEPAFIFKKNFYAQNFTRAEPGLLRAKDKNLSKAKQIFTRKKSIHFSKSVTKQSIISNLCYLLYLNSYNNGKSDYNISSFDKKANNINILVLATKLNLKYSAKILKMLKNNLKQTNLNKENRKQFQYVLFNKLPEIHFLRKIKPEQSSGCYADKNRFFNGHNIKKAVAKIYFTENCFLKLFKKINDGFDVASPGAVFVPNLSFAQAATSKCWQETQTSMAQKNTRVKMARWLRHLRFLRRGNTSHNKLLVSFYINGLQPHNFSQTNKLTYLVFCKKLQKKAENLSENCKAVGTELYATRKNSFLQVPDLFLKYRYIRNLFTYSNTSQAWSKTNSLSKPFYNIKIAKQKRDLKLFPKVANIDLIINILKNNLSKAKKNFTHKKTQRTTKTKTNKLPKNSSLPVSNGLKAKTKNSSVTNIKNKNILKKQGFKKNSASKNQSKTNFKTRAEPGLLRANLSTLFFKTFSKKTKTIAKVNNLSGNCKAVGTQLFAMRNNKLFFKQIISSSKTPFFDYEFKKPSYSFTYTAKTTNFKNLYSNRFSSGCYAPVESSIPVSSGRRLPVNTGIQFTGKHKKAQNYKKLFISKKFSSAKKIFARKQNKTLIMIPKQPCLNICFSKNFTRAEPGLLRANNTNLSKAQAATRYNIMKLKPEQSSGCYAQNPGKNKKIKNLFSKPERKLYSRRHGVIRYAQFCFTTFLNNLEFFSNFIAQTNNFSPFQGELLYTKQYKAYLDLNPYKNLKTGLNNFLDCFIYNLNKDKTKEAKMRMAMFTYYLKTITKSVTQQGWSRFNLILTKKDLLTLNYTQNYEKNLTIFSEIQEINGKPERSSGCYAPEQYLSTIPQFTYSQAYLNSLFKKSFKNIIKIQPLSRLNKENHFNEKYNFNLKNMWLKQLCKKFYQIASAQAATRKNKNQNFNFCKKTIDAVTTETLPHNLSLKTNTKIVKSNLSKAQAAARGKINLYKIKISLPYNALISKTEQNFKNLSENCAKQPELKRFEAVGTELYATRKKIKNFTIKYQNKLNINFSNINELKFLNLSKKKIFAVRRSEHPDKSSMAGPNNNFLLSQPTLFLLIPGKLYYQNDFCNKYNLYIYKKQQIEFIVYLLIPYNCILNFKWFNFKQKKYITKNKVGFFLLKGNTFFNQNTKFLNTFLKNYTFLNNKIYNLKHLTNFLQDSRYLDLQVNLELQKLHLNLNFLQLKPFFDKTNFARSSLSFAQVYIYHNIQRTKNFLANFNFYNNFFVLPSEPVRADASWRKKMAYALRSNFEYCPQQFKVSKKQRYYRNYHIAQINLSENCKAVGTELYATRNLNESLIPELRSSNENYVLVHNFYQNKVLSSKPVRAAALWRKKYKKIKSSIYYKHLFNFLKLLNMTSFCYLQKEIILFNSLKNYNLDFKKYCLIFSNIMLPSFENSGTTNLSENCKAVGTELYATRKKQTNVVENINNDHKINTIKKSGQLIHMNKQQITLRLGQPLVISPRSIIHATHGDFISYKKAVITLTYQQLTTGDIVQGIPKIEQLFEARTTKRGRLFRDNVSNLLTGLFLKYFVKSTYLLRKNLLDVSKTIDRNEVLAAESRQPVRAVNTQFTRSSLSFAQVKNKTYNQLLNNKQNQTMILALALQWSVKQSFYKIQQIIVDGILRVYRSQGVSIADKHVEIIVKQMTSKVRIINSNASKMNDYSFNLKNITRNETSNIKSKSSVKNLGIAFENKLLEKLLSNNLEGPTGLFPGEIVDIDFVENINTFLLKTASLDVFQSSESIAFAVEPIKYEPIVLGITRASLEVDSFLSAASFQQTTKVLSQAALYKKKDFLKGLKENIIIGNLIPAGTGYLSSINL